MKPGNGTTTSEFATRVRMMSTRNYEELGSDLYNTLRLKGIVEEGDFKKLGKLQDIQEEEDEESIVIRLKFTKKIMLDVVAENTAAEATPMNSFLSVRPRRHEINLGANFFEPDITSDYKIKLDLGIEVKEEKISWESSLERMYLLSS